MQLQSYNQKDVYYYTKWHTITGQQPHNTMSYHTTQHTTLQTDTLLCKHSEWSHNIIYCHAIQYIAKQHDCWHKSLRTGSTAWYSSTTRYPATSCHFSKKPCNMVCCMELHTVIQIIVHSVINYDNNNRNSYVTNSVSNLTVKTDCTGNYATVATFLELLNSHRQSCLTYLLDVQTRVRWNNARVISDIWSTCISYLTTIVHN
jgi:hypothetical protein